jgi:hypothetical protein
MSDIRTRYWIGTYNNPTYDFQNKATELLANGTIRGFICQRERGKEEGK